MNVSRLFISGQLAVVLLKCVQQTILVNERNQHNSFPFLLLSVQVCLKICWIKVYKFTFCARHEFLVTLWNVITTPGWQHAHQLLERQERRTHFKLDFAVLEIHQVADEWSVVMWIIPAPGLNSVI